MSGGPRPCAGPTAAWPARRGVLLLAAGWAVAARGAPADPWAPLRRLAGEWAGRSTGRPGEGTVMREYTWVLSGRYLHERSVSVYPAQQKNRKGERHEHVGYLSFDRGRGVLVLRQFHVEGFVNTYRQAAAGEDGAIVFDSEALENAGEGWRARETWRFDGDHRFTEVFELAAPGQPLSEYSRTELERRP